MSVREYFDRVHVHHCSCGKAKPAASQQTAASAKEAKAWQTVWLPSREPTACLKSRPEE